MYLRQSYPASKPNNSFKPNLLRYSKSVAEKACHAFASTTQVGLTQALGDDPVVLMDAAEWWILERKPDHFEKAVKIRALVLRNEFSQAEA